MNSNWEETEYIRITEFLIKYNKQLYKMQINYWFQCLSSCDTELWANQW